MTSLKERYAQAKSIFEAMRSSVDLAPREFYQSDKDLISTGLIPLLDLHAESVPCGQPVVVQWSYPYPGDCQVTGMIEQVIAFSDRDFVSMDCTSYVDSVPYYSSQRIEIIPAT